METLFLVLFLLALIFVLVLSAKLVETSFIHISNRFKVNEFFLGFFILAIVTSLPETSIALVSSSESPELSLGNLLGATIVILTLILGISAIRYKGINFKGKFSEKEVVIGLLTILLMVLLISDGVLTVIDSAILVISYGAFIYYLYKIFNIKGIRRLHLNIDTTNPIKVFAQGLVGIVGIILSSSYIVSSAEQVALNIGVSQTVIGLLMLAIGTNLPEITILLTAKRLEEEELAVGSFFGSACVNVAILGILGITSRGFEITDYLSVVSASVILTVAIIFFTIFSWTSRKLSKSEGILLLSVYFAFLMAEVLILFTNR